MTGTALEPVAVRTLYQCPPRDVHKARDAPQLLRDAPVNVFYYLFVFSRAEKDILKQYLLKFLSQGDTWTGPFLGGFGRGNEAVSQLRPAVIALG